MTDDTPSGRRQRSLVILAEGHFGFHHGKTAVGVIRYGPDQRGRGHRLDAGGRQRLVDPAGPRHPDRREPRGGAGARAATGHAPDRDRPDRRQAAGRRGGRRSSPRSGRASTSTPGCTPSSATTPSSRPRPRASGTRIVDYRRPPARTETAVGRHHGPGKRVILTVGTDCAIGKMTVGAGAAQGGGRGRAARRRSCRPARPG